MRRGIIFLLSSAFLFFIACNPKPIYVDPEIPENQEPVHKNKFVGTWVSLSVPTSNDTAEYPYRYVLKFTEDSICITDNDKYPYGTDECYNYSSQFLITTDFGNNFRGYPYKFIADTFLVVGNLYDVYRLVYFTKIDNQNNSNNEEN